jgi:hypothetical protein
MSKLTDSYHALAAENEQLRARTKQLEREVRAFSVCRLWALIVLYMCFPYIDFDFASHFLVVGDRTTVQCDAVLRGQTKSNSFEIE